MGFLGRRREEAKRQRGKEAKRQRRMDNRLSEVSCGEISLKNLAEHNVMVEIQRGRDTSSDSDFIGATFSYEEKENLIFQGAH